MECGCGAVLWVLVVSGRTCVRAWQLAEEHGLALARQADEHHRVEEKRKRKSRKLRSIAQADRSNTWKTWCQRGARRPRAPPRPVFVLALIRLVQGADVDALEEAAPFGDGGVIGDMTMLHYSRSQRIEQLEGLSR